MLSLKALCHYIVLKISIAICLVLFSAYAHHTHTLVNVIAYLLANLSRCKQDGTKLKRLFNNGEEIQLD